jgi:lipoyl(octanoyl) transferase
VQMIACKVVELGLIGYSEAFALQQRLVWARKLGAAPNVLLICEHPNVFTLGRNGKIEHLCVSDAQLRESGVEFHRTDRGGDITYHGPGQVVGYPILNLGEIRRDVLWYVRQLEAAMISATARFGVEAFRVPGRTGVWVHPRDDSGMSASHEENLAAIGVRISRWVTSHGLAYNVSTDLRYFELIVPCGLSDCRVTSLERLLGHPVPASDVRAALAEEFGKALGLEMVRSHREELDEWVAPTPSELTGDCGALKGIR